MQTQHGLKTQPSRCALFLVISASLLASTVLVGCGDEDGTTVERFEDGTPLQEGHARFTLKFSPTVNGTPFSCAGKFEGIGMGQTTSIRVLDFRLWLHDIELVRASGEQVPLTLDESRMTQTVADRGAWQRDGVVLLDFEDATGSCTGTSETNSEVVGAAPAHDDYVGVVFKVGVPTELNHLDATVSPYPFGMPGMAWQWKSGYRFVRIDVETAKHPKYYFHLGSTACDGEIGSFSCTVKNIAEISLQDFDPARSQIEVDLASIYDELDVDGQDTTSCMSGGTTNTLCPSMFGAFGLQYGESSAVPQRFFRVVEATP